MTLESGDEAVASEPVTAATPTPIDYKVRSEHLMHRLDCWVAQYRWEMRHGPLVRWDVAFLSLLAHPDPDSKGDALRERMISTAAEVLQQARDALRRPKREPQLKALARIDEFLADLAKESANLVQSN